VADRWGSLALDAGKVVWAVLHGEDEPPKAAGRQLNSAGMTDPARG
jgi:hypothetical protein